MAFDQHVNFGYGTVLTAPSPANSGTGLTLQAGQGQLMPAAPFNAVVWPANAQAISTNSEIVRVAVVSGDTLTITRGPQAGDPGGTTRAIVAGDQVAAAITIKTVKDIEALAGTALQAANNLSDLANAGSARSNLGLANSATATIDTTAGDFQMNGSAAAGSTGKVADAGHIHPSDTSRLAAANNLSDVASPSLARTNLGLGAPQAVVNLGSVSGTVTCDLSQGTCFTATMTGACTFNFINWPASPALTEPLLILTENATGGWTPTITGVVWEPLGVPPAYNTAPSAVNIIPLSSPDQGAHLYGSSGSGSSLIPVAGTTNASSSPYALPAGGLAQLDLSQGSMTVKLANAPATETVQGYKIIEMPSSTTLSSALATTGAITSLAVVALPNAIPSGEQVLVQGTGATASWSQLFTLSSPAALSATAIAVTSQTPAYAFPIGSTVMPQPSLTIQTQGSDVLEIAGGAVSGVTSTPILGLTKQYLYQSAAAGGGVTGIWFTQAGDNPLSQLDSRYPRFSIGSGLYTRPAWMGSGWMAENPDVVDICSEFGVITSATDNGPAINYALSTLGPLGLYAFISKPGVYPLQTTVGIGNGTINAASTWTARLKGCGLPPWTAPGSTAATAGGVSLKWTGTAAVVMTKVIGGVSGWGLENLLLRR